MATPADRGVALLSIHPQYAQAIMAGTKSVEFRKQPFGRPVSHIVIYETAPTGRIVGAARVASCDVAPPAELWERYADVGAIGSAAFDGYYEGRALGVAIKLETPPMPLDLPLAALGQSRPPQSFTYLCSEALEQLGLVGPSSESSSSAARRPQIRGAIPKLRRLLSRAADAVT